MLARYKCSKPNKFKDVENHLIKRGKTVRTVLSILVRSHFECIKFANKFAKLFLDCSVPRRSGLFEKHLDFGQIFWEKRIESL